ncbi:MAG: acetyl-CoA carboxylase carboxyltransferase subunit alpha [Deltaproteobacteria bacterium]|nr:acetyl-CoA carboxylase carboxyltransferase subunit alpha [Deltaproteobacteria bacterium]
MTRRHMLDFEKPIEDLEKKIEELRHFHPEDDTNEDEIRRLSAKADKLTRDIFSRLTPWQITQLARHPSRPYALDYIEAVFEDFVELHGDRLFKDDPAIVGGLAKLGNVSVVVIGQQKGRNTKEKVFRNFGMPHPEGYRKALRLMRLAERFSMPVITLIDTPGAYPGVGAEERGQSEAIAANLMGMSVLKTPVVAVIIGEGGSGGALALAVADRVMMFEYSTYSVISPEGCAAILWKDGSKADLAAKTLRLTADNLIKFGIIDRVIKEPSGGAQRDPKSTVQSLKAALSESLAELKKIPAERLVDERIKKFRKMGEFAEQGKV